MDSYVGEISPVAFNFAPKGWALCNGQILQISQNTALFSLLGTTFGGDGIRTFALPDLRGRVSVHSGNNYILGTPGGVENVSLILNQIPPHSHTPGCSTQAGTTGDPANQLWAGSTSNNEMPYQTGSNPNGYMVSGAITPTGNSQAHTNLQPYLVINYIIALQGIYPTRN
jgi:microcystin-dependent protein